MHRSYLLRRHWLAYKRFLLSGVAQYSCLLIETADVVVFLPQKERLATDATSDKALKRCILIKYNAHAVIQDYVHEVRGQSDS